MFVRDSSRFNAWFLQSEQPEPEGFYENEREATAHHHVKPWWKVMCLTGVDYFSTLGYQPGIAALAAGALAPIATLVLVLVTLFGALPMYRRVAAESPHGDGSLSMLERLLSYWPSKILVLALIGFVATGFIITITLSAADASAHLIENPLLSEALHGQEVVITLVLLALLAGVFLKGFGEAIGIAVFLVAAYIGLSAVVVADGFLHVLANPSTFSDWTSAVTDAHSSPLAILGASLLVFPALALGLSGFETGVVVMPLVKGDPGDTPAEPAGRIRNARKLLTDGRADHERHADGLRHRHHPPHPRGRVRAGRRGERAGAGLPRPRVPRGRVRHRLRRRHHRHPLVRRVLGDGRAAQHRPPLPAPVRDGAGLGPRHPPARRRVHPHRRRRHDRCSRPTSTPRPAPTPPACSR